jgi:hypothetical protein
VAAERARRVRPRTQEPSRSRGQDGARARAAEPEPEPAKKASPRNKRVVSRPRDKNDSGVISTDTEARRARVSSLIASSRAFADRFRSLGLSMLRGLSMLAALAGAVAIGRLVQQHLTTSRAFAVEAVEIRGLTRMTRSELLAAAGIDVGTNVFARSPEEVRARLLKHPWIAAATVQR